MLQCSVIRLPGEKNVLELEITMSLFTGRAPCGFRSNMKFETVKRNQLSERNAETNE